MVDVEAVLNYSYKRAREDDDPLVGLETPSSPKIRRTEAPQIPGHESVNYYFDDGNVIIFAPNTRFRVHQGVLSKHSSYFRDIFAALPVDGGETLDECPVVRVEESPQTVKWLLDTMYDGADCAILKMRNKITLSQLVNIFRAGDKYNAQHLRKAALHRLRVLFPADLQEWAPFDERKKIANIVESGDLGQRLIELTKVLVLIRDFPELKKILPLVLYTGCQLPITVLSGSGKHPAWPKRSSGTTGYKNLCLLAIPTLVERRLEVFSALATPVAHCQEALLTITYHVLLSGNITARPCALEDIIPWCKLHPSWDELCRPCAKTVEDNVNSLRLEVWSDLETIFGIPE
ncbi:hypothetical protein BDY19DRAFT_906140 [Irpex rosettiformis]|uniref:Uncharacterized protein n=1 Tax=Irpex rosettiformis TaxID=378272 RepID=A0ACB8U4U7_9APHY|nr:hypothetical protein BDY19DRAFT_906140 [Irpex rosettiformis]